MSYPGHEAEEDARAAMIEDAPGRGAPPPSGSPTALAAPHDPRLTLLLTSLGRAVVMAGKALLRYAGDGPRPAGGAGA